MLIVDPQKKSGGNVSCFHKKKKTQMLLLFPLVKTAITSLGSFSTEEETMKEYESS